MNPIRHIRRIAAVLATLAAALVAVSGAPRPRSPGCRFTRAGGGRRGPGPGRSASVRTVTHTVVLGGMPGWQIALIAAGTALLAAALAVLADRARASHRKAIATAA